MFYTNKQSISSHFVFSANHVDKQVMLEPTFSGKRTTRVLFTIYSNILLF